MSPISVSLTLGTFATLMKFLWFPLKFLQFHIFHCKKTILSHVHYFYSGSGRKQDMCLCSQDQRIPCYSCISKSLYIDNSLGFNSTLSSVSRNFEFLTQHKVSSLHTKLIFSNVWGRQNWRSDDIIYSDVLLASAPEPNITQVC